MTLVTWTDNSPNPRNTFDAWLISSERWNGHAKPWFTDLEMSRLAEMSAVGDPDGPQFRFNESTDPAILGHWEYKYGFAYLEEDEPEWHRVPSMEWDGVTVWQAGDGWTWRELNVPEDPEDRLDWMELATDIAKVAAEFANTVLSSHSYARGQF